MVVASFRNEHGLAGASARGGRSEEKRPVIAKVGPSHFERFGAVHQIESLSPCLTISDCKVKGAGGRTEVGGR